MVQFAPHDIQPFLSSSAGQALPDAHDAYVEVAILGQLEVMKQWVIPQEQ
jgi:hypothetical protein